MENQTFLWCIFCGFGTMQVVYRKEEEAMKKILAIIGIVILILAGGLAVSYNGLAGSRESVETAQADVCLLYTSFFVRACGKTEYTVSFAFSMKALS